MENDVMSRIIHLQNLPPEATSAHVRDFFEGLQIADGGVHITNSYDGSVFINFNSEADASAALELDGRRFFGECVKLNLCTEEEKEEKLNRLAEEEQILDGCQDIEDDLDLYRDQSTSDPPYQRRHETTFEERDRREFNWPANRDERIDSGWDRRPGSHAGKNTEIFGSERNREFGESEEYTGYFLMILNVAKDVTEGDLTNFFKGVKGYIDYLFFTEDPTTPESILAHMKFTNRRAYEIALKMDDSTLHGKRILIRRCTEESFYEHKNLVRHGGNIREAMENFVEEKSYSPKRRSCSPPREYGTSFFEYHESDAHYPPKIRPQGLRRDFSVRVSNLEKNVSTNDIQHLFAKAVGWLRDHDIVLMIDPEDTTKNVALLRVYSERKFHDALTLDGKWYRGLNISVTESTGEHLPRKFYICLSNFSNSVFEEDIRTLLTKAVGGLAYHDVRIRIDPETSKSIAFVRLRHHKTFSKAMGLNHIWFKGEMLSVSESTEKAFLNITGDRVVREKRPFPFLFLADLDDDLSPKDIRHLFQDWSSAIPRDGILIRPDDEQKDKYVAFIKFEHYESLIRAKAMWNGTDGIDVKGRKIFMSEGTTYLFHKYNLGSLFKPEEPAFEAERGRKYSNPGMSHRSQMYHNLQPSRESDFDRHTQHFSRQWLPSHPRSPTYHNLQSNRESDFDRHRQHSSRQQLPSHPRSPSPVNLQPNRKSDFDHHTQHSSRQQLPSHPRSPSPDVISISSSESQSVMRSCSPGRSLSPVDIRVDPFQRRSRSHSPSWSSRRSYSSRQSQSPTRRRNRSYSRSHSRSSSPSQTSGSINSKMQRQSHDRSRSPLRRRSRSRSPSRSPRRKRSYSRSRSRSSHSRSSSSRSPPRRHWSSDDESTHGTKNNTVPFKKCGRFIRISQLPSWANDIWLNQFFMDCQIKKESILIKHHGTTPVHAYLECITDADFVKALQKDGTLVGTDKICVEPLGK